MAPMHMILSDEAAMDVVLLSFEPPFWPRFIDSSILMFPNFHKVSAATYHLCNMAMAHMGCVMPVHHLNIVDGTHAHDIE